MAAVAGAGAGAGAGAAAAAGGQAMSPAMAAAVAAMQPLFDFTKPVNVSLLDNVVEAAHGAGGDPTTRAAADMVLAKLLDEPNAWRMVDTVLESTKNSKTLFFALQILENAVKFRWGALPADQRKGIRDYVVKKVIGLTRDEATARAQRMFVGKLNVLLVQILKKEWPHNWPSFIPDIVSASKASEVLCTNNMEILKLLSEEVFDFSKNEMTSAKIEELKTRLNSEFSQIFQLCEFILTRSRKPALLQVTLQTLLRFITWIPLGYIFETKLVETLCMRFFAAPAFRTDALACLAEIGNLSNGGKEAYDRVFEQLYVGVLTVLQTHLPPTVDVTKGYDNGSDEEQMLIQRLSLFFTGFYKAHLRLLEAPKYHGALVTGLQYMIKISNVNEPEIFKIALDLWHFLTSNLYETECKYNPSATASLNVGNVSAGLVAALKAGGASASSASPRKQLYAPVLSRVRLVMINHMVKPEEVLIKEDDSGDIVRETAKDTEALAQYKVMKETLVKLTHLDYQDTENLLLGKLAKQVDGTEWSWNGLNTLCWAVGSISGAMTETDEKRFLVIVIRDLLGLCEHKPGKNNKAVVASNIMYVVGQYPRFLRQHWKFLKTVVLKLFEFMHEKHPGVQDMACDTFLKIAQKLKRKFVMPQQGESTAFIYDLCENLPATIVDLEIHQIHAFYEAVGHMVSAHPEPGQRTALLERVMNLPNAMWRRIMGMASRSLDELRKPDTVREVQRILRTFVRTCKSVGPSFITQMGLVYFDMLNVYKAYSEFISVTVAREGPKAMTNAVIKLMSSVKKEALFLIQTFVQRSDNVKTIATKFVPPLLKPILADYQRNIPAAREAEVLQLMAVIVTRLRSEVAGEVPSIMEALFECTLAMVKVNYTDFPDHRIGFYKLLDAVNTHTFAALFSIPVTHQKLVIQAIMWGVRHSEPKICELALHILQTLLNNVSNSGGDGGQAFWQHYYVPILQDVLYVLTDRMHKFAFKQHATLLRHLCGLLAEGHIKSALFDAAKVPAGTTNELYIKNHIAHLLAGAFSNLTAAQVKAFVNGLFDMTKDLPAYKTHLRDFLIEMREFKAEDNRDLYREEQEAAAAAARAAEAARMAAIPGMAPADDDEDISGL